jgi:polo-like kinase 1
MQSLPMSGKMTADEKSFG